MQKSARGIPKRQKKLALYEVLSKGLSRSDKRGISPRAEGFPGYSSRPMPTKPRAVQYVNGRLELILPLPWVVLLLLCFALALMGAYRLGERMTLQTPSQPEITQNQDFQTDSPEIEPVVAANPAPKTASKQPSSDETAASDGKNWIVIQSWKNKQDLIPVQAYFDGNGILTQIRKVGSQFILHTVATYDNPKRLGSDGYLARQRIVEIGAGYQPPPGYGKFDFSSAYGMKSIE